MRTQSLAVAILAFFILGSATGADARSVTHNLDIPSQGLNEALRQLALTSRHKLFYKSELAEGKTSPALKGEFTIEQALQALLRGTNLTYDITPSSVVLIRDQQSPPIASPNSNTLGTRPATQSEAATLLLEGKKARVRVAQAEERGIGKVIKGDEKRAVSATGEETTASKGIEEIVVTGSNLRVNGSVGATNLRVIDAIELSRSSVNSVASLLQRLHEVGFGGFGEHQFNTSSPGSAAVSLRGLGANANLVLVNGRRVTNAPFARNTSGGSAGGLGTISFVDLNLIPISAVERVDVLKDGAAAIYGADAVSGVVNLVLRSDYDGSRAAVRYGNFLGSELDAPTYRASFITGASRDGRSITVSLDYLKRDRLAYRNLPFAVTSLSSTGNPGTFVVPVGGRNPITGATIPAGASTASRTFFVVPGGSPGNVQFSTTPSPGNFYDNVGDASVQPAGTRLGAFAYATMELTDSIESFAEISAARVTSQETSTPSSISNLNDIVLPANNPFNPFGVTLRNVVATNQTQIRYRFVEYETDEADLTTTMHRVVGGVRGHFGSTGEWEVSQTWNPAQSQLAYSNKPSQALVNAALADTNPATSLNLFTSGSVQNSGAVMARLIPGATRDADSQLNATEAKVAGKLFDLPAGAIAFAAGAEYRQERFSDRRTQDRLMSRGDSPAPASGRREVKSAFAEVRLPLISDASNLRWLHAMELNLAARTESFSSPGVGTTTTPRVGLRIEPVRDQVTLRAAWGECFRAPSLTELYLPSSSGTLPITDPLRFGRPGSDPTLDGNVTRINVTGGNVNLRPEESVNYNFGVQLSPKFIPELAVAVDYYSIDVTRRIGTPTIDFILNNPTLFPGQINRAAPTASDTANGLPGVLIGVSSLLNNLGYVKTEGWDLSLRYRRPTENIGTFTFSGGASYVDRLVVKLQPNIAATESIGTYENPRVHASASLFWTRGSLDFGFTANHVGAFRERIGSPSPRVGSQTTVDWQASIDAWSGARLTVGLSNITNRRPPAVNSFSSTTGYAERTNAWQPRAMYVEVSSRF